MSRTSLRLRVLPRIPINIVGTNGIKTILDNFNYTIAPDFPSLVQITTIADLKATFFQAYNNANNQNVYNKISASDLLAYIQSVIIGPTLTLLSGLTPAANKVPLFTGTNSASTYTVSPFVQDISGSASAGAFLGAIGAAAATAAVPPDILPGPQTSNPYAGPYPSYMYGIGGIGYYDIKALAYNGFWSGNSSYNFAKRFTYGSLDQATAVSATANSNRPGFIAGFTAPSQVSAYDEFGATALGAQIDSVPIMLQTPGTFTATTFTPITPFITSDTLRIEVGMWIRTNDDPAYNGQVTAKTVNGLGQVTQITVSNWYSRGGGAGTPTGNRAFINPQDKVWGHLNTTFLNQFTITGNTTNGGYAITNLSSTAQLVGIGQFVNGAGITPNTCITGVDYVNGQIFLSSPATATTTGVTLSINCGTEFNKGSNAEIDIFNNGPDFIENVVIDTGNVTTGSRDVTNLVLTGQWRPGLVVYGTGPLLNYVTSVSYGTNALRLKYPATITGTGVVLKARNQHDECGAAYDFVAPLNRAHAAIIQRTNFYHGYKSHGAYNSSFIVEPFYDSALPQYGFRVEGRFNGMPTVAPFAVTLNNTAIWKVDGTGKMTGQLTESANGYTVTNTPVVGSRKTGWTADTGTAKRTANATYSATADAAYTQATIQTLMNEVRDLSQTIKALKDDLIAHGLIGT